LTGGEKGYTLSIAGYKGGTVEKKDKNLMVRISKETHTALKEKAAAEGTTMSEVVRYCIDLFLKGRIRPPK
jgi:predicted DNA binding CopG/RHH family protein